MQPLHYGDQLVSHWESKSLISPEKYITFSLLQSLVDGGTECSLKHLLTESWLVSVVCTCESTTMGALVLEHWNFKPFWSFFAGVAVCVWFCISMSLLGILIIVAYNKLGLCSCCLLMKRIHGWENFIYVIIKTFCCGWWDWLLCLCLLSLTSFRCGNYWVASVALSVMDLTIWCLELSLARSWWSVESRLCHIWYPVSWVTTVIWFLFFVQLIFLVCSLLDSANVLQYVICLVLLGPSDSFTLVAILYSGSFFL